MSSVLAYVVRISSGQHALLVEDNVSMESVRDNSRFTEAELAELAQHVAKLFPGALLETANHDSWHAFVALQRAAPCLIAAARLANDQAERANECDLCKRGFPLVGGYHIPTQALGMIPPTPCASQMVLHQQLAERDATIAQQAERIAELETTLGCYRDGSDWPAGMREKFSEQENALADRDATIERLTAELTKERNDRRRDIDAMRDAEDRLLACMRERDAARDLFAKAKALADDLLPIAEGAVINGCSECCVSAQPERVADWRARRAELDR